MKARRRRLEKYCNALNCDTLVTFEPENLFYLTGFWGEAIGMLEKDGKTTIIAPELEAQRAKEDSVNCNVVTSQRGGLVSSLASTIKKKKICTNLFHVVLTSFKHHCPTINTRIHSRTKTILWVF